MHNFDPQSVLNDLILVESHLSLLNVRVDPDTSDSQIAVLIGRMRAGLAVNGFLWPTRFSSVDELKQKLELGKQHLIQLLKPSAPQAATTDPPQLKRNGNRYNAMKLVSAISGVLQRHGTQKSIEDIAILAGIAPKTLRNWQRDNKAVRTTIAGCLTRTTEARMVNRDGEAVTPR